MIISVSIRFCKGGRINILKNFGLVECENEQTSGEVFKLVSTGVLSSGDSFVLHNYLNHLPKCLFQ